jgi:hypothetical protein
MHVWPIFDVQRDTQTIRQLARMGRKCHFANAYNGHLPAIAGQGCAVIKDTLSDVLNVINYVGLCAFCPFSSFAFRKPAKIS